MKRQILDVWVKEGLSQREMAMRGACSQMKIKYWLKQYELKTARAVGSARPGKCRICDKQLLTSRRRRCGSCDTRVRRFRQKQRAVNLLGGKCWKCEWSGPIAGFDFHHAAGDKEMIIGQVANKKWSVIEKELKKCVLLCRCCHAIHHSKHADIRLLTEIAALP